MPKIWQICFKNENNFEYSLGDFATDIFHNIVTKFKCFLLDFKVSKSHFAAADDNFSAARWIYGSCTGLGGLPGCLINHCSVWIKTSPEKFHFSGSCGTNKMDMILDYYQYFICLFFLFSYSSHPRHLYPLTPWSKWKH